MTGTIGCPQCGATGSIACPGCRGTGAHSTFVHAEHDMHTCNEIIDANELQEASHAWLTEPIRACIKSGNISQHGEVLARTQLEPVAMTHTLDTHAKWRYDLRFPYVETTAKILGVTFDLKIFGHEYRLENAAAIGEQILEGSLANLEQVAKGMAIQTSSIVIALPKRLSI